MPMSRAQWGEMTEAQKTKWEAKQPMGAPGTNQEDRDAGIYSEKDINVKRPYLPATYRKKSEQDSIPKDMVNPQDSAYSKKKK